MATKQPTVHNPTNFNPADYTIVDYFDNKRPPFYGDAEAHAQETQWWEQEATALLGSDYRSKIFKCIHCGNGTVRWITIALHIPSNERVVFGCDCTERLGFANQQEFKLAQLKAKAEAGHARLKIWNAREAYVAAHPEIAAAIEQAKQPAHANNSFVKDVLSKLNQWGSLSERQAAAVVTSLARDLEFAARKAAQATEVKGPAPTGRVTVTGKVLSTKVQESQYGETLKMLLQLENNSRVWLTVPSKASAERGETLTVTATFQVSKDDPSFAFGSRPVVK
jgi:hypothetical protein